MRVLTRNTCFRENGVISWQGKEAKRPSTSKLLIILFLAPNRFATANGYIGMLTLGSWSSSQNLSSTYCVDGPGLDGNSVGSVRSLCLSSTCTDAGW